MKSTVLSISLALVTFSGSALASQYPLTITDDLGRNVVIKSAPKRVISIVPSTTETLCAIGACNRLIAIDDYSDFPASVQKLPKVGGLYNTNFEAIVAAQPDLVLVSKYAKQAETLSKMGLTVVAVNPEKYADIFSKTVLLGKIVSRESQATQLNLQLKRQFSKIEALTAKSPKVSTYFEIDPTPYSIGPKSFMGVVLGKAGASNIITANMGDFPKISPEYVVQQNPQLMLGLSLADAQKRPGWNNLKAVKNKQVFDIPADLSNILSRPGPRLGLALEGLAKIVHPELF